MRTSTDYEKNGQNTLNRNLKYLMFIREMEQQTLAAKLGVSAASVSKKMGGQHRWSIGEMLAIGDVFEIPPTLLVLPHKEFVQAITASGDLLDLLMRETRCSSAPAAA